MVLMLETSGTVLASAAPVLFAILVTDRIFLSSPESEARIHIDPERIRKWLS